MTGGARNNADNLIVIFLRGWRREQTEGVRFLLCATATSRLSHLQTSEMRSPNRSILKKNITSRARFNHTAASNNHEQV